MIKHKYNIDDRKLHNMQILEKLLIFYQKNPDIRFCQGLQILGLQKAEELTETDHDHELVIKNNFHEESEVTFNKIKI